MNPRLLLGIAVAVLAASGCGLKGPLYLPEKSDVTIRPAPAATAPKATHPTDAHSSKERERFIRTSNGTQPCHGGT